MPEFKPLIRANRRLSIATKRHKRHKKETAPTDERRWTRIGPGLEASTGHQKPPKATKGHQKRKFAESAAREESFYRSLPIFTAPGFSGSAGFDL
jgi:hypothetical protein